jgi:hypothetical protein
MISTGSQDTQGAPPRYFLEEKRTFTDIPGKGPAEACETRKDDLANRAKRYLILRIPDYAQSVKVTVEIERKKIDPEIEDEGRTISDSFRDFEREVAAFGRILPGLLKTHQGVFVAIRKGQVIDQDKSEFSLAKRVHTRYRNEFVLIRPVEVGGDSVAYLSFESPGGEI